MERSIQGHTFFKWAVFQTISKIDTWLLLFSVASQSIEKRTADLYMLCLDVCALWHQWGLMNCYYYIFLFFTLHTEKNCNFESSRVMSEKNSVLCERGRPTSHASQHKGVSGIDNAH